jgi:hypothetical protein
MQISKSTYFVFIAVITVMTLSVTVFKRSAIPQQDVRRTTVPLYDRDDRYPVVESNEVELSDPVKKSKLKRQKQRYDKDAPFRDPGPNHSEVAFLPEGQFGAGDLYHRGARLHDETAD